MPMHRNITPALLLAGALCVTLVACTAEAPAVSQAPADAGAPDATAAPPAAGAVTAPDQATPATASLVLPGSIGATTTLAELRKAFGDAAVVEGEVPGAEGETFSGWIIHPDTPTRRAYVYLEDGRISSVRVADQPSEWALDNGIGIGTPLAEVIRLNGLPIRFYGLEWDYGGTIIDWGGGALDPAKSSSAGVRRQLRLAPREGLDGRPIPTGDGEFSSTDKQYPELGKDLVVGEIGVSFAGKD